MSDKNNTQTTKNESSQEEETNELLSEIFEQPSQEVKKSHKSRIVFWSFVVAVITGLSASIIGVFVVLSGSLSSIPILNEFSLDTILPEQQVVVRREQAVTLTAFEQLNSIATKSQHSIVTIVTQKSSSDLEESVYTQEDVIGYGVVLTSDGWIATSQLTMTDEEEYEVITSDYKRYNIEEILDDELSGVQFLKISAADLFVAQAVDEYTVVSGDELIGLYSYLPSTQVRAYNIRVIGYTDTAVISSTEEYARFVSVRSPELIYNVPVFNFAGELVGLHEISPTRGSTLIPVTRFISVFNYLLENQVIARPSLGIEWINLHGNVGIPDDLRQGYNKGAYVTSVEVGSPALEAGILEGDIVLKVNDVELNGGVNISEFLQMYQPGETVYLEVIREGELLEFEVKLEEI